MVDLRSLRREVEVLTDYLIDRPPNSYVTQKYIDGHDGIPFRYEGAVSSIDTFLVRVARRGRLAAGVADAYARIFRTTGALRQKLVLLSAVLENSRGYHTDLTAAVHASRAATLLVLLASGTTFAIKLVMACILFGPVHLVGVGLARLGTRRAAGGAL